MSMIPFGLLFPEFAERETRSARVFEPLPPDDPVHVPADEYGFIELYCAQPGCDCRRVMINVVARHARGHMATINHGFDKPGRNDPVPDQTFLDPINTQTRWARGLLHLFVNQVLADEAYRQRLESHHRMFKNVVDGPAHPKRRLLPPLNESEDPRPERAQAAPIAPQPRRQFKKRPRR